MAEVLMGTFTGSLFSRSEECVSEFDSDSIQTGTVELTSGSQWSVDGPGFGPGLEAGSLPTEPVIRQGMHHCRMWGRGPPLLLQSRTWWDGPGDHQILARRAIGAGSTQGQEHGGAGGGTQRRQVGSRAVVAVVVVTGCNGEGRGWG